MLSLAVLITGVVLATCRPSDKRDAAANPVSNTDTSLTLLFQNNLNETDDKNHVGALLLDSMSATAGAKMCASFSESLLPLATVQNYSSDFSLALGYNAYAGRASYDQSYHINDAILTVTGAPSISSSGGTSGSDLPVLCTQSNQESEPPNSTETSSNEIRIAAAGNNYIGYRNQKSFRFLGIPFADPPARFEYSTLYSKTGQVINATAYGASCLQAGTGAEDCLFMNIQTPYLPKAGSTKNLRPVLFWIYGGGFTGGTASDPLSDGGNLASREDIVVVSVNYRVSTLGFLAIPGTDIKGNFGIGDQITGLEWTVANIEKFGGDPKRITINGESAGAGSVRALLASPKANGMFQGAIAMSNLGGGQDLGLSMNYGTTFSSYLTIQGSYEIAGQQIFHSLNCNQSSIAAQVKCLKKANATDIILASTVARYVVQDGSIITTPELDVVSRNNKHAYVPIMFGNAANDGASFSQYPLTPPHNLSEALEVGLGINASAAHQIINSGLFPLQHTGNTTNDYFNVTQRVATDNTFRCIDQATAYAGAVTKTFPAAYYYQFERTINGYNPNNVSGTPVRPGYPHGDPNLPYYKLHGADMPWAFGNMATLRDPNDLYSTQLVAAFFAEFVKSGQPNPDPRYLTVRGYTQTLQAQQEVGPWMPVNGTQGPIRHFDYPGTVGPFVDTAQCAFLNYSISYYVDQKM